MSQKTSQRYKDAAALAAILEVQRAVEVATSGVIDYLKQSPKPIAEEAHLLIDKILQQFGCESPEGHIVAGGIQAIEPHNVGTGVLERNQSIVIDIYPRSVKTGYWADMSRTVCLGTPSVELQTLYDTVLAAQQLAIGMVAPGVACAQIQEAVEDFFIQAGYTTSGTGTEFAYAEGFVHGVGHGVGKQIHEAPRVNGRSGDVLEVGDVITIEPGLYYASLGAVRIEDMVVVTEAGANNLTRFPKTFVI